LILEHGTNRSSWNSTELPFYSSYNPRRAQISMYPFCITASKSMQVSKGKAVPLQAWTGPESSRKLRLPDFMTVAENGGRLSVLSTGCLYPQEILLVLVSVRG